VNKKPNPFYNKNTIKMKKILIIILLAAVFLPGRTLAQDEKTNALALSWGVGNLQRQDIRFSPFVFKPWSAFNLGLSYEHTGKQFHRVYARFGWYKAMIGEPFKYTDTIEDPPLETETLPHNFNILDLDYTLGFTTLRTAKTELLIGGKVRNLINQGPYEYGPSSIGAYNFFFGIDAWSAYRYKINDKHSLKAEISLPLFAWVASSPYLGQDSEYIMNSSSVSTMNILGSYIAAGEMQSWGTFQRVDFQLGYIYQLSERWKLKAEYNLDFCSMNQPQPYTSIENLFLFSAQIKL
jgi:hypothetical protein